MKFLKYFIAIIGILHQAEAKAFQPSEDDVKGPFDHMYENLYLKKIDKDDYELRYVPHVNGKPIFIPSFDEIPSSKPSKAPHFTTVASPKPSILLIKNKKKVPENLKENKLEMPVVVDVVTKADDLKGTIIRPIDVNSDFTAILKPSKQSIKKENVKPVLKETTKPNYGNSLKPVLKQKLNENPAVDGKISFNHDSPIVIESLTEEIDYDDPVVIRSETRSNFPKTEIINKVEGQKTKKVEPVLYANTPEKKVLKSENKLAKHEYTKDPIHSLAGTSIHQEENTEAMQITKPQKHQEWIGGETESKDSDISSNESLVKSIGEFSKSETSNDLYSQGSDHQGEKYYTNGDGHDNANLKIVKKTEKTSKDYDTPVEKATEINDYDNPIVVAALLVKTDKTSHVYDTQLNKANDDRPVVVEALVQKVDPNSKDYDTSKKKTTEMDNYDSPVVVEALVQKVDPNSKDYDISMKKTTEVDNYDSPVVVEALVQKVDPNSKDYDTSVKKATVMDKKDNTVVIEALVKKPDQKEKPDVSKPALTKKYPVEFVVKDQIVRLDKNKEQLTGEEISNGKHYGDPLVEGLATKTPVKKRIKYSSKLKHPKSPIHSHYDDSTKLKTKNKLGSTEHERTPPPLIDEGSIKKSENTVTLNPVSLEQSSIFSNEDLIGEENDQFDVGSGVINERSLGDSRFSKSNVWPILTSFHSQERNKFKKCTTPDKEPGNCMPIQMCPTPNLQLTLDDLMKKICSIDEVFIGICCPEFPVETLKVDWDNFTEVANNSQDETKPEECGKMQGVEDPQSWPWMAPLISVSTRRIFCGGVLIKEQYVLTAAHCTRKIPRNQIVVVLGPSGNSSTNQEFEVVEIKRHAQYNPKTMQNDLALLKLSRKAPKRFICLPDEETFVGVEALLLGWQGSFAASKIDEKLLVLSSEECRKAAVKVVVGNNIMCTQPRTDDVVMCNVDSGAPLIVKHNERYQVIGILTWNRNDCDSSFPAIFTRVSHFTRWIENHSSCIFLCHFKWLLGIDFKSYH